MGSTTRLPDPPEMAALLRDGATALFLDFDGTLVDLAAKPDAIEVHPGLARALEELAQRLDGRLALVSGRSIDDLEQHLGPLSVAVAGSHGAEKRLADGSVLGAKPDGIETAVTSELATFALTHNIDLETKSHGAALHYRSVPDKEDEARAFAAQIAQTHGLEVKLGKCVVELVARGANKGSAVRAFMETKPFLGSRPFFIGDDVTDEDGFAACAKLGGDGILVGTRESKARYVLKGVADVHQWLELV